MTPTELRDAFKANLDELHAQVDALIDGPVKTRLSRRALLAHSALEAMLDDAVDGDQVEPFDGGTDKGDGH